MRDGRTITRKEAATVQMGFQMHIRFEEAQIQSSARHKRFQTRTWGRLRRNVFTISQDDHPPTPPWGRGDGRPRVGTTGRQNDIPKWRFGRRHLHVSTGRLHGAGEEGRLVNKLNEAYMA